MYTRSRDACFKAARSHACHELRKFSCRFPARAKRHRRSYCSTTAAHLSASCIRSQTPRGYAYNTRHTSPLDTLRKTSKATPASIPQRFARSTRVSHATCNNTIHTRIYIERQFPGCNTHTWHPRAKREAQARKQPAIEPSTRMSIIQLFSIRRACPTTTTIIIIIISRGERKRRSPSFARETRHKFNDYRSGICMTVIEIGRRGPRALA